MTIRAIQIAAVLLALAYVASLSHDIVIHVQSLADARAHR